MPLITLDKEIVESFEAGDTIRYDKRLWRVIAKYEKTNELQIELDRRNRKQRRIDFANIRKRLNAAANKS